MNFFAIPTLNSVRSCLRLPISMMPRFSLKLTLARLRTGIDSAGSRLRPAAEITVSATLTSFFSTGVGFFAVGLAMGPISFFAWSACSYALPPSTKEPRPLDLGIAAALVAFFVGCEWATTPLAFGAFMSAAGVVLLASVLQEATRPHF